MSLHSEVDFRNTVDTGEPEADAIVPYTDGEPANQAILRRPVENNRSRTDILRSLVRNLVILADLDRPGMIMNSTGAITFAGAKATYAGTITLAANIEVFPFATPGDDSVGTPYLASLKSSLTTGSPDGVTLTSKYKQWEAPSGGDPAIAQEANMISVEIKDTGTLTVDVEGATGEVNNIVVGIDFGTTTVQQVVDAINADTDANKLVVASVYGTAGNACPKFSEAEWGSDYSARFLRGGAAGIAHVITNSNLATFFGAHADNPLRKGDTLAIWYDKLVDLSGSPADDGRFQSTYENTNQTIPATAFFNSRREPEKLPNSIPICKCLTDDRIQFADGTIILRTVPAKLGIGSLGELAPLAPPLSWDRMGTGTVHNPPTTVREGLNNADGHINEILNEIEAARNSATFGAFGSLDARLEDMDTYLSEVITARTSDVFGAKSSLDARLEAAEAHSTLVVSCTDGTASTGGMYNGVDSLEIALNALKAVGGTILVAKGNYEIFTAAITITKPIQIIGIDGVEETRITCSTTGATLIYNAGSGGSLIEGVTFDLDGASPDGKIILIQTNLIKLRRTQVEGGVTVETSGFRTSIEFCILQAVLGSSVDALEVNAAWVSVQNSIIQQENTGYSGVTFSAISHHLLLDNVFLQTDDGCTAIKGEGDSGGTYVLGVTFRSLRCKCAPFTGATHVVDLGMSSTYVLNTEGLHIQDIVFDIEPVGDIAGGLLGIRWGNQMKVDGFTVDFGTHKFKFQNFLTERNGIIWAQGCGEITNVHILGGVIPNVGVTGWELDGNGALINIFDQTSTGDGGLAFTHSRISGLAEDGTPSGNSNLCIIQNACTGITAAKECLVLDNVTIDCYYLDYYYAARHMLDIYGCADIRGCRFRDGFWGHMFRLDSGIADLKFRDNSIDQQNENSYDRIVNAQNSNGYVIITGNAFNLWSARANALIFYLQGFHNVFSGNMVGIWTQTDHGAGNYPTVFRNVGNYLAIHGNSIHWKTGVQTLYNDTGTGTSPAFASLGTYNAVHAA